jgi:hypothetical protein
MEKVVNSVPLSQAPTSGNIIHWTRGFGYGPTIGPAHLIVGAYGGATSRVRAPGAINYLLVTLKPGERLSAGEFVTFENLDAAGDRGAGFGSTPVFRE